MKRTNFTLALTLCGALLSGAAIPVREANVAGATYAPAKSPVKALNDAPDGAHITFFEGFEEYPGDYGTDGAEWLPTGWKDTSKAGNKAPAAGEGRYNLTWRVLNNENKSSGGPSVICNAFEGEAFAYIHPDMAYGDHTDLANQDEWLITPAVTPVEDDWLYFKLFYFPSWVVYNRANGGFDARNNQLEVLASTDNGKTWTTLWNVVDDVILKTYTEEELRKGLVDMERTMYEPMYVNIKDYVGKSTRFAFRYFGSMGQAMGIDNVTVGVPVPKAHYQLPRGFFRQGLSPMVDYPQNPKLLAPPAVAARWMNDSEDAVEFEWTYTDAEGQPAKSTARYLNTPAYHFGTEAITPVLTAKFEKAVSEPYCLGHSAMQVGGVLTGSDHSGYQGEFGIGYYDITEPGHSVKYSSEYVSLNPNIDLAWEKVLGQVDGSVDVLGFCTYFEESPVAYGFDYVDVTALVLEDVPNDEYLLMTAFSMDSEGYVAGMIGQAIIEGKDMPKAKREYVNLRFNFLVPVHAEGGLMVMVSGLRSGGNVAFPCLVANGDKYGNNLILLTANDPYTGEYEAFQNLNYLNFTGGHFAGLLVNIGASYSWMERTDSKVIEVPMEGGSASFAVRAYHEPDRWKLTDNGLTEVDYASFSAVYNPATEAYDVTLTVTANPYIEARPDYLYLVTPGSLVELNFVQPGNPNGESGLSEVSANAGKASVSLVGNVLTVKGAKQYVTISNVMGQTVMTLPASASTANVSTLAPGVYVVTVDGTSTFKLLKK